MGGGDYNGAAVHLIDTVEIAERRLNIFALLTNIGAAKLANATALRAKAEITQMAVVMAMVRCRHRTRHKPR